MLPCLEFAVAYWLPGVLLVRPPIPWMSSACDFHFELSALVTANANTDVCPLEFDMSSSRQEMGFPVRLPFPGGKSLLAVPQSRQASTSGPSHGEAERTPTLSKQGGTSTVIRPGVLPTKAMIISSRHSRPRIPRSKRLQLHPVTDKELEWGHRHLSWFGEMTSTQSPFPNSGAAHCQPNSHERPQQHLATDKKALRKDPGHWSWFGQATSIHSSRSTEAVPSANERPWAPTPIQSAATGLEWLGMDPRQPPDFSRDVYHLVYAKRIAVFYIVQGQKRGAAEVSLFQKR
ncbi:hypothetical protein PG985_007879 [Apiospora marii]|uniref:Uncharacterized protein n=1 Tax=Apiospora marii TaxID=335849 RepID=A0ABR1RAR2_9PEZI